MKQEVWFTLFLVALTLIVAAVLAWDNRRK